MGWDWLAPLRGSPRLRPSRTSARSDLVVEPVAPSARPSRSDPRGDHSGSPLGSGGWGGIRTHEGLLTPAGFQDRCLKPLGHPSGRAATSNEPPFRLARPRAARASADRETVASPIARWRAPQTRLRCHYWTAVQSVTNFLARASSARTTWSRCESVGAPKRTAVSHKFIVTGTKDVVTASSTN